jgi:hypothetical protein
MKQATVKTLGAAALGAAIAATGAGSASAVGLDGVQETAGDLVHTLPVDETADDLPGDGGEIVRTGTKVLTGKNSTLPLASDALSHTTQGGSVTADPGQLLGGLPLGGSLTGGGLPL